VVEFEKCTEKYVTGSGELLNCVKTETVLTKDPLKVSWVKLGCENRVTVTTTEEGCYRNIRGVTICYSSDEYRKCKELKSKLGL
jgi:hypothetical protein